MATPANPSETLTYNFLGTIGSADNPATVPIQLGLSHVNTPQVPVGGLTWAQSIVDGYNASATSLGLTPLPAGTVTDAQTATSAQILDAVSQFARAQINTPGGIFKILIPGASSGFLNAVWYKAWDVLSPDSLGPNDTSWHEYKYQGNLNGIAANYNSVMDQSATQSTIDLTQTPTDYTLNLGAVSNKTINLGNGNNIVISSPVMVDYSFTFDGIDGSRGKSISQIIFPSSQGNFQSNTISAGNGDNVIYYDSSYKSITTGDGNNIFAPSFGSFNWAANNLQMPGVPNGSNTQGLVTVATNNKTGPYNSTLLAPTPISNLASGQFNVDSNIYQIISSLENVSISRDAGTLALVGNQTGSTTYVGRVAFGSNSPETADGAAIKSLANNIGGESIVAGNGNDLFYGADPGFYSSVPDMANGGSRYVYVTPQSDPNGGRFNLQNYTTIVFCGGGGSNTFELGDPTKITPNDGQFTGVYSYQISTTHGYIATEANKSSLEFVKFSSKADDANPVVGKPGVNVIDINLTSNDQTYNFTSSSFDQKAGTSTSFTDSAALAGSLAVGLYKAGYAALNMGAPVLYGLGDIAAGVLGVGSAIWSLVKGNAPAGPTPITLNSTQLSQPLGLWKQAIEINDWNPKDIININITPTITTSPGMARWNSTQLTIGTPDTSSDHTQGVSISYQQGSNAASPLLRLDGLGATNYGYYSYDFTSGSYKQIDQTNLNFFGHVAAGVSGINPLANYTAGNGLVFSSTNSPSVFGDGSYIFYWNDSAALSVQQLNDARESASTLSLEFDSRSLGWYWNTRYLANSSDIDAANSKLWIESTPGKWISFTYDEMEYNPLAYADGILAHTYYQVGSGTSSKITTDEANAKALANSALLLSSYVSDLKTLNQSSLVTKLTKMSQLTSVVKATENGKDGVDVYYTDTDGNNTFKAFVYTDKTGPVATKSTALTALALVNLEEISSVDLNGDGSVGKSVINHLNQTDNASFVSKVYDEVLNRSGDASGNAYWLDQLNHGATRQSVVANVLNSNELQANFSTNDGLINFVYAQLLGRAPESTGQTYWDGQIQNGLSHDAFIASIMSSEEFLGLVGAPSLHS